MPMREFQVEFDWTTLKNMPNNIIRAVVESESYEGGCCIIQSGYTAIELLMFGRNAVETEML
jgi:hypothetical protein